VAGSKALPVIALSVSDALRMEYETGGTSGSRLLLPFWFALKAEALHLAGRTCEALETLKGAETLTERRKNVGGAPNCTQKFRMRENG